MNTINNNSRITLYLSGLMNKEEATNFENEMDSNPSLKSEVYLYRTAQLKQFTDLKNRFKEEYAQMPVEMTIHRNWQPLRIAASIFLIALLGAGSWFGINQYQDYQAELARQKARQDSLKRITNLQQLAVKPIELINSNIADSKQPLAGVPKELNELVQQYERAESSSDYSKVAQQFRPRNVSPPTQTYDPDEYGGVSTVPNYPQSVAENTTTASYRAFYHGLSLLALEKYDAAIRRFDAVNIEQLSDEVQWYKALTYLKKGDNDSGSKLLESIVNSESKFKSQAQELIDSIKESKK